MFRKSRIMIVATIMSILSILWIGTLSVIFITSYYDVSKTNYEMLEEYANNYFLKTPPEYPGQSTPSAPTPNRHQDTNRFKLSTFYSAAIGYDGEVVEVQNDESGVYTDDQLAQIAKNIIDSKDEKLGVSNNLIYFKLEKNRYILICFMDNTILQESMSTLFKYTLVFGSVIMIALFFLALYLANNIVKPLEESYEKQKQFISDAGHELKTPISVVSANAELLSREIGDNQWLANIQYENERMGNLVGQLLELARTETSTQITERLDFGKLVIGGTLPFESLAFEKGILIETKIDTDIYVNGNSTQLGQLISILIDNAIRHGNGGKTIKVISQSERGHIRLSVINSGEPLFDEQRSKLFERFYRADEVRNGEDKHYGLGLSIAKAIVTAHNGKIEVLCNNGLIEFKVSLPKA